MGDPLRDRDLSEILFLVLAHSGEGAVKVPTFNAEPGLFTTGDAGGEPPNTPQLGTVAPGLSRQAVSPIIPFSSFSTPASSSPERVSPKSNGSLGTFLSSFRFGCSVSIVSSFSVSIASSSFAGDRLPCAGTSISSSSSSSSRVKASTSAKVTRRRLPGVGRNGSNFFTGSPPFLPEERSLPITSPSPRYGSSFSAPHTASRAAPNIPGDKGFLSEHPGELRRRALVAGECAGRFSGFGFDRIGGDLVEGDKGASSSAASREVSKSNASGFAFAVRAVLCFPPDACVTVPSAGSPRGSVSLPTAFPETREGDDPAGSLPRVSPAPDPDPDPTTPLFRKPLILACLWALPRRS
mmetsp:Transcript_2009/g.7785  ORF Transcript_2009/g.7785 Transcript_2009/m.7785 type:complete len:352 (-) Transcript_2009:236-1291(-)